MKTVFMGHNSSSSEQAHTKVTEGTYGYCRPAPPPVILCIAPRDQHRHGHVHLLSQMWSSVITMHIFHSAVMALYSYIAIRRSLCSLNHVYIPHVFQVSYQCKNIGKHIVLLYTSTNVK